MGGIVCCMSANPRPNRVRFSRLVGFHGANPLGFALKNGSSSNINQSRALGVVLVAVSSIGAYFGATSLICSTKLSNNSWISVCDWQIAVMSTVEAVR